MHATATQHLAGYLVSTLDGDTPSVLLEERRIGTQTGWFPLLEKVGGDLVTTMRSLNKDLLGLGNGEKGVPGGFMVSGQEIVDGVRVHLNSVLISEAEYQDLPLLHEPGRHFERFSLDEELPGSVPEAVKWLIALHRQKLAYAIMKTQ